VRVLGIAGYSGSGKTTLIVRLLPLLRGAGLEVATLKHAHHRFDVLPEAHASQAWRAAGARELLLDNGRTTLLLHELRGAPEPPLEAVLSKLAPVDLLLIEGYKFGPHPKLEVYRVENDTPLLAASDRQVIALATDCGRPSGLPVARRLPIFSLDDVPGLAAFISAFARGAPPGADEPVPAGHDAAER
jgi:molybdopterin-guanine dinucleotide biosynthesis protein B